MSDRTARRIIWGAVIGLTLALGLVARADETAAALAVNSQVDRVNDQRSARAWRNLPSARTRYISTVLAHAATSVAGCYAGREAWPTNPGRNTSRCWIAGAWVLGWGGVSSALVEWTVSEPREWSLYRGERYESKAAAAYHILAAAHGGFTVFNAVQLR